jgi:hypothetical protein
MCVKKEAGLIDSISRAWMLGLLILLNALSFAADHDRLDWSLRAHEDLSRMDAFVRHEHPGYLLGDLRVRDATISGLRKARLMADEAHDVEGWYWTLHAYVDGFNHEGVWLKHAWHPSIDWPGFRLLQQDTHWLVVSTSSDQTSSPAIGSELISCDHQSIDSLMHSRQNLKHLLPYEADHWLFSSKKSLQQPLKHCLFVQQSASHEIYLKQKPYHAALEPPQQSNAFYQQDKLGFWLHMPNLHQSNAWWEKALSSLATQQKSTDVWLIWDLRGNRSSEVVAMQPLLSKLLPTSYLRHLGQRWVGNEDHLQLWHVSQSSLAAVQTKNNPHMHKIKSSMKTALLSNKPWVMDTKSGINHLPTLLDQGKQAFRMILISDQYCGKQCLWALRSLKSLPGSLHIGVNSKSFSRYDHSSAFALSHQMKLYLPSAVWLMPKTSLGQALRVDQVSGTKDTDIRQSIAGIEKMYQSKEHKSPQASRTLQRLFNWG